MPPLTLGLFLTVMAPACAACGGSERGPLEGRAARFSGTNVVRQSGRPNAREGLGRRLSAGHTRALGDLGGLVALLYVLSAATAPSHQDWQMQTHLCPWLLMGGSLNEAPGNCAGPQSAVNVPGSPLPPSRSVPGGEALPTAGTAVASILERARKLAGLWVMEDNGQTTYLEWMEFCQDWARHRLKQTYFERYDVHAEPPRERESESLLHGTVGMGQRTGPLAAAHDC